VSPSAVEIARTVRSGERSAREVVDQCLAAIDAREATVHAFNLVLADEARAAAEPSASTGPWRPATTPVRSPVCQSR
jgi:Asp-tRNA(Asn)/Glu-tRNA(Gln) amidotransferase A subunit family amidase